jgi:hypothetical protein
MSGSKTYPQHTYSGTGSLITKCYSVVTIDHVYDVIAVIVLTRQDGNESFLHSRMTGSHLASLGCLSERFKAD